MSSSVAHDGSGDINCPCCDNPWARATGDMFAVLCATCDEKKDSPDVDDGDDKGLSRSNMDLSIAPSTNFFRYANGSWMKNNPIPSEYPSWNTFMQLRLKSQEQTRDICESLLARDGEVVAQGDTETAKLKAFYTSAMDEDAVEKHGIRPLEPLLALVEQTVEAAAANDTAMLGAKLGEFQWYGVSPFFSIGASPDNKNSDHSICQVAQGGLGLPDRDYYFDGDKAEKREAYKEHVANMLYLLDNPTSTGAPSDIPSKYTDMVSAIYTLEESLAKAHMTKTENRDPHATYNKMSMGDFGTNVCKDLFDVVSFMESATKKTVEELGDINIRNLQSLTTVATKIADVNPDTLRFYLKWHCVRSCAMYLPKAFEEEKFNFYERTLSGTKEMKPRWKRVMEATEGALGEALGKVYCDKHFDESCKGKALGIVESVRQALEDRLNEVEWMTSEDTRKEALKKMNRFKTKIGFPDKWIDYGPMQIAAGQPYLTMIFASRAFHHQREVEEMNAPTDKDRWFMTPQTVNAYYHPSLNEIVFPAAILQAPFFIPDADDAVNYGAMGAVIGHEMTHGFDDKGRQYNFQGNMEDWWTVADGEEYERRVEVMVNQANEYKVHGQKVQGKLTCGENIADLGGLRLAYRALKSQPGFDDSKLINGFTPTQRFFLSWAQAWRQNITKERALQLLTMDPHGPNEMRCNGPLSNIAEFHRAFGIQTDASMYKPLEQRVDIW